jgi:predicted acyl esterase
MMPHIGVPGPAIGFLQECVRWWDQWLKGIDTGIMAEPRLRAWMQEYVTPAPYYAERPGRWVGVEWPREDPVSLELVLDAGGNLRAGSGEAAVEETWVSIAGVQHCGETAGVWCANGKGHEMATDQRPDDACSLTFTTVALVEPVEVLGRPSLSLRLRVDRPLALVSARLEDVAPDGQSLLVCWELLNLTHRESHETPHVLGPGEAYDVGLELGACGHVFAEGHRIRLALSPTYWPNAWPSPEKVTLEVALGPASRLELPLLGETGSAPSFEPAEAPAPLPDSDPHAERVREITVDAETGLHEMKDRQVDARTIAATGVRYIEEGTDTYSIADGDPLSAAVRCWRETRSEHAEHPWRVGVSAEMTCDAEAFFVTETYSAHEGEELLFTRTREHRIPRDHV